MNGSLRVKVHTVGESKHTRATSKKKIQSINSHKDASGNLTWGWWWGGG